ncbi:hypothetical protein NPIL_215941 [Nephila pilipes]|uniref:Uncharacterized protein n=1 Tax=Nephila pilipes TaxID=299642 RepID=A0A8X6NFK4_NEPPI|nr:hypothetical protein NPIL_215941 [Nephila pilipes]
MSYSNQVKKITTPMTCSKKISKILSPSVTSTDESRIQLFEAPPLEAWSPKETSMQSVQIRISSCSKHEIIYN